MSEKPFNRHRRKYGQTYAKGEKVRDVRLLHANQTTQQWVGRAEFQQQKLLKSIFCQTPIHAKPADSVALTSAATSPLASGKPVDDSFRSNLLSKIPINSTIVGSTSSLVSPTSTPMNRSFNDDFKTMPLLATNVIGQENSDNGTAANAVVQSPKIIYNNAIDAFTLIENRKGFLNTSAVNLATASSTTQITEPTMGIYCVRWRRTDDSAENETKLFVNCVGKFALNRLESLCC